MPHGIVIPNIGVMIQVHEALAPLHQNKHVSILSLLSACLIKLRVMDAQEIISKDKKPNIKATIIIAHAYNRNQSSK